MKIAPSLPFLCLGLGFVLGVSPVIAGQPVNVLPEGTFEKGKGGEPEGFTGGGFVGGNHRNKVVWESDRGGKFIRVELKETAGKRIAVWSTKPTIPVAPAWREITVKFRVRTSDDFKVGSEPWHDARVIVNWLGEQIEGENILRSDVLHATKVPLAEWKPVSGTFKVPKGAEQIRIELGTWGASGTIDFDDLEVLAD